MFMRGWAAIPVVEPETSGGKAARNGWTLLSNPYQQGTENHEKWEKEWLEEAQTWEEVVGSD